MTIESQTQQQQDAVFEKALQELEGADITRLSADHKRQNFTKLYKQMDAAERLRLCEKVADILKDKYVSGVRVDGIIYMMAGGLASERDWEAAMSFLKSTLRKSGDAEFFREIALILLEIADNELSDRGSRIPMAQTCLVLLTELGLLLANRSGQSALDTGTERVVEYITTSLLARSNINNNAMRISLVHYLSKCPVNQQATLQLNRVISRFGQSLLDDLLTAFFEDKKRGNAAFYFLLEHLNSFFCASPALAEMAHNVLRHYMLKFPTEFPMFMASYTERVQKETSRLRNASKHIALLLRAAIDVSQKPLAENICKILVKHLAIFRDAPGSLLREEIDLAVQILQGGQGMRGSRGLMAEEFIKSVRGVIESASVTAKDGKVLSLAKAKKVKEVPIKFAKIGEEPSPLESMLQLAS